MREDPAFSRRDLLRGYLFRVRLPQAGSGNPVGNPPSTGDRLANDAGASLTPNLKQSGRRFTLPIHRPPGAVNEAAFLAGCTRCGDCISACPVGAIALAPPRFREAAGTPYIEAHTTPCILCEDAPCITACQPGVLRADLPRKMGVAWIQTEACLAYTGTFCSVCVERCPVPGSIQVKAGKPTILAETCLGCGVCAGVCPAPQRAIVVMPLADRPMPPSQGPPEARLPTQ